MRTVCFGGFNDVVLGTTQTCGEAILQLANALFVLRRFRQHRKFPRLDIGTVSEIRAAGFINAHRIVVSGLSRHSLNIGESESHRGDVIGKTPSSPSSVAPSASSGHDRMIFASDLRSPLVIKVIEGTAVERAVEAPPLISDSEEDKGLRRCHRHTPKPLVVILLHFFLL